MKLYVCYGTWRAAPRPGGHPCGKAFAALEAAGHHPEVVKSYGLGVLPEFLNQSAGRKRAKELTGSNVVPVLELDDGTGIGGSDEIVAWAQAHPATAPAPA
jgi:hypothetical protein